MTPSLHAIAQGLGGEVRGNRVVAPDPEAASKKGYKKRKRTLTVWINADSDIGVNSHTGQDPIATKDWVRRQCGLPAWEPRKRKPKPLPSLRERNQYLGESLRIARSRRSITFEQFALIINDLKNACSEGNPKFRAAVYGQELGFAQADIEAAMRPEWRAYTASERAAIFQITYDEYRHLGLRRSGCIEVDAAERRCRTKARYNAKRRADRTAKRVSKSANDRAPLCPPETVGTVRVPSSAVVELVGSRRRDAEVTTIRTEGLHGEIEKTEIVESTARRSPPIRVTVQLRLSRKQRKRNGRNRGSSVSRAKSGCSRETRRAPAQRNAARRLVKNNRRNQLRWPGVVPVQGQVEKGARSARQSENWPRWPRNTQRPPCLPLSRSHREVVPPRRGFQPP